MNSKTPSLHRQRFLRVLLWGSWIEPSVNTTTSKYIALPIPFVFQWSILRRHSMRYEAQHSLRPWSFRITGYRFRWSWIVEYSVKIAAYSLSDPHPVAFYKKVRVISKRRNPHWSPILVQRLLEFSKSRYSEARIAIRCQGCGELSFRWKEKYWADGRRDSSSELGDRSFRVTSLKITKSYIKWTKFYRCVEEKF